MGTAQYTYWFEYRDNEYSKWTQWLNHPTPDSSMEAFFEYVKSQRQSRGEGQAKVVKGIKDPTTGVLLAMYVLTYVDCGE